MSRTTERLLPPRLGRTPADGRRDGTSRFLGVFLSGPGSARPWSAQAGDGTKRYHLGTFATEEAAAVARDRAVLYYQPPRSRLNFPHRNLSPADVGTLREEARARFKRTTTSRYWGVRRDTGQRRWTARIEHKGHLASLGTWNSENEAAEAYDRAARFLFGDTARLNFPGRRLEALAPHDIRRLAYHSRKAATKTSEFRGVFYSHNTETRPWTAQLRVPVARRKRTKHLGTWPTASEAAAAYDRAARFYLGSRARLNFPDLPLPPANVPTLLAERRRAVKMTKSSPYIGVYWSKGERLWIAKIMHHRRTIRIGSYARERAAGEAYDGRAIELHGLRARLNFHPVTRKQVWGMRLADLMPQARVG